MPLPARARQLPGTGAVKSLRESAFHTFEAKGLPHRRVEEWKYTDLRALMRDAKPLAPPPDAAAKLKAKSAGAFLADVKARRIVIVDGIFAADLSDLASPEPGLSIGSLAEALAKGDADVCERVGRTSQLADDAALALNTAMMADGAVIRIADGAAIARPLHLVFVTTPDKAVSLFTRTSGQHRQGRKRHPDRKPRRAGRHRPSGQSRARSDRRGRSEVRSHQDRPRGRPHASYRDIHRRDRQGREGRTISPSRSAAP